MFIEINKKQDVIVEAGNVYNHTKRKGVYLCCKSVTDGKEELKFVDLKTGEELVFTFTTRKELQLRGKILNVETTL